MKFGLQKLRGGAEVNVNEARNRCRGCGADIYWAVTTNHKIMPVEFINGEWISHFANCHNAKNFKD